MSKMLGKILSADEADALPGSVREKLQKALHSFSEESDRLRAVVEHYEFQLEAETSDSQARLRASNETCQQLRTQVSELEEKVSSTQRQLFEINGLHESVCTEMANLKTQYEQLQREKKDIAALLEKRRKDADRLNDELKAMSEQAIAANEAKFSAIAAKEEAELKELNFQHQQKRLTQEKELLHQQFTTLGEELSKKNQECVMLRRDKSSAVLQLELELGEKVEELRALQVQMSSIKSSVEQKDKKIESLAKKVRDIKETYMQSEEQFQLELRAQMKLVDLYQKANDSSERKINELLGTVEEMHKLLQEAAESHRNLEKNGKALQEAWDADKEEKRVEMEHLRQELERANHLLSKSKLLDNESLENLFPTAASTSRALKSGMTLTEIYSEYVRIQEDLIEEKSKNQKLNRQLQDIVTEIEEATPYVNQKFTEYQKAMETITCLREQLVNAMKEHEQLQAERDDACRSSRQHARENERFQQEVVDLSQQVRMLLKEVEEARGGYVSMAGQEQEVTSTDDTTAAKVITQHLVTFRDIEELQGKNQQLLAVVRDLSQRQEEEERKAITDKTNMLQQELEKALLQLEELGNDRTRQAEMVASIVRQRDMYRVLLSQGHSLSPTPHDDPKLVEAKAALKQLQQEHDAYKKEKGENISMMTEQMDKLRDDLSDLRIQNAKLTSQLEYSQESLELVQSNMENFKKEAIALREKNQKFSASMVQHQQTINVLRQDLMSAQEKLAKAEVSVENLQAERDLLKNVEVRLLQEKESITREHHTQGRVLANLQAVQNNLERLESETKHNLEAKIEKLEQENAVYLSKLENEAEQHKSAIRLWEKQARELKQKIEEETTKCQRNHDELVDAYAQVHELKQELTAKEVKLSAAESKLPKTISPGKERNAANEIRSLKEQLNEIRNEKKVLQEKLALVQKSAENYQKTVLELEVRQKEESEASQKFKVEMEKIVNSHVKENKQVSEQLDALEKQRKELLDENVKLVTEKTDLATDLNEKLSNMQRELKSAKDQAGQAIQNEQQARQDRQQLMKELQEAKDKYERELILHAEHIQASSTAKEELQAETAKLLLAEEALSKAKRSLEEGRISWNKQEQLLKSEVNSLKHSTEDLERQNSVLLEQMELMSTQMAALQSKNWSDVSLTDDNKSADHLMEVIKFLRREKEIALTQSTAAEAFTSRLKVQVEFLEKQLEENQNELKAEREHSQAMAATEVQHSELMRKVQMLNLLNESNQLLRSEKETIEKRCKDAENRVSKLEQETIPLNKRVQEYSGQMDALSAENTVLRAETKRWQTRANQLLEQTHKICPEDYKKLHIDNEELKKQSSSLTEEVHKHRAEASRLNASLANLQREFNSAKVDNEKLNGELTRVRQQLESVSTECTEQKKALFQVRKIARKYKGQFDELKQEYDKMTEQKSAGDSKAASQAAEAATAKELAQMEQAKQDLEQKLTEAEEKNNSLSEEMTRLQENVAKLTQSEETLKTTLVDKEEKAKRVMTQARQKIAQLSGQKDNLIKEKDALSKEVTDVKNKLLLLEQTADEESLRLSTMKSQYENKQARLEKELKEAKEHNECLEKQAEELNQKLAQQKLGAKPSTSAGPVERSGGVTTEPLTANIRPLTPPAQSSGGTTSLRHTGHPHIAPSLSRIAPTASIRPMALSSTPSIGTPIVQARMVAVPPTTALLTASSSSTDEPISSSAVLVTSPPSTVPQATVQPTPAAPPATATVAPSTAVSVTSDTMAVTVTPPSHIPSVTPTVYEASVSVDTEETPSPTLGNATATLSIPAVATAMVIPRVEVSESLETSNDLVEVNVPSAPITPSTSGTQVAAASPSVRQVKVPAVKRHREAKDVETPVDAHEQPAVSPQMKRVRMVSEGSQTASQTAGVSSMLVATPVLVSETESVIQAPIPTPVTTTTGFVQPQPQVLVTPVEVRCTPRISPASVEPQTSGVEKENATEVVTIEGATDNQEPPAPALVDDGSCSKPEPAETESFPPSTSDSPSHKETVPLTEEVIALESDDDDVPKTMPDTAEVDKGEFEESEEDEEGEDDNDEDEEDEEAMDEGENSQEEFGDEQMQETAYTQEVEEDITESLPLDAEDMSVPPAEAEDGNVPFEGEGEDMADQQPDDEVEVIDVGSDVEDHQMEDQDAPSATTPVVQARMTGDASQQLERVTPSGTSSATSGEVAVPAAVITSSHRPSLLPRMQARTERLLSAGRQQLPPFSISGQGTGYEEGDDSIVPSTPTLFVPRRGDGFAEAVSSPHVPQARFVFNSTPENVPSQQIGLSQLATQGALGVDDTRMDLLQFDESGGRTVPSTPLQVSPPADTTVPEVPEPSGAEALPSASSATPATATAAGQETSQPVPIITVTNEESVQEGAVGDTEQVPKIEDPEEVVQQDPKLSTESSPSGLVITEVTSLQGKEDSTDGESDASAIVTEAEDSSPSQAEADVAATGKAAGSSLAGQSQHRKPIVWEEPAASGPPQAAAGQPPFTSPLPRTLAHRGTGRVLRSRRIRLRGSSAFTSSPSGTSRGSSSWGMWRGRGGTSRGGHGF